MSDETSRDTLPGAPDQDISAPAAVRPGQQLAARRAELGLTIDQVANQLNLAPRQIQAIESDNYAALPGIASVKGFIRAYAKLVRLDPAPLLAVVAAEATPVDEAVPLRRPLPGQPFSESRLTTAERKRAASAWRLLVLGIVLLAALAYAAQHFGWLAGWQSHNSAQTGGADSAAAKSHTAAVAPPAEQKPADAAAAASANGASAANATTTPAPDASKPEAAKASVAGPSTPSAPGQSRASEAAGTVPANAAGMAQEASGAAAQQDDKDRLVLKLREDSWIEIRRPDDTVLVSRLFKAGAVESFRIPGAVSLAVGNASGVDATLRGAPLDLNASAKSNVARVNLK